MIHLISIKCLILTIFSSRPPQAQEHTKSCTYFFTTVLYGHAQGIICNGQWLLEPSNWWLRTTHRHLTSQYSIQLIITSGDLKPTNAFKTSQFFHKPALNRLQLERAYSVKSPWNVWCGRCSPITDKSDFPNNPAVLSCRVQQTGVKGRDGECWAYHSHQRAACLMSTYAMICQISMTVHKTQIGTYPIWQSQKYKK